MQVRAVSSVVVSFQILNEVRTMMVAKRASTRKMQSVLLQEDSRRVICVLCHGYGTSGDGGSWDDDKLDYKQSAEQHHGIWQQGERLLLKN